MRRRILVVDDDALIRNIGRRAFLRAGLEVEVAGSIGEARSLLTAPFDLAVLDYFLASGECGCDLIAPLRALNPSTWIAILSGLGALPELIHHAHRCGADTVTTKGHVDWEALALGEVDPAVPVAPFVDLASLKRDAIHGTFLVHNRNVSSAARALGMMRGNLQRLLRKMPPPDLDEDD